ncbi:methyltransferase [Candidatus Woesearchaeota archaeon]|nr:methyltransferase [Candidatus Woesearchaeota archaeon]
MEVYAPAEDSFLILEAVREHASGKVLEIGTGSGLLSIEAAKMRGVSSVTATDISSEALAAAKKSAGKIPKISFIHSDLFDRIPLKKYKTIIFNPPYLPQDRGISDRSIYGGKKGFEIIGQFLGKCNSYLSRDGKILLVFSSLTNKGRVDGLIAENCLEYGIHSQQSLFFERLYCYVITKSGLLRELEKKNITAVRKIARGHRGIIYSGMLGKRKLAVKSASSDSTARGNIACEAKWLRILNRIGIGPRMVFSGRDYFAYEFVEGEFILDFIRSCKSKTSVMGVIKSLLIQCCEMDRLKISKEEMHHPVKHIIVTNGMKPVMIDFERCHRSAKPKNMTQFLQFLSSGHMREALLRKGIQIDVTKIRSLARAYRRSYDCSNGYIPRSLLRQ